MTKVTQDSAAAGLIARRDRLMGSAYRLFYENPIHLVKGEGVWLYDADGKKYLDLYNNVPHVGHCHPHVVEALTRQIIQPASSRSPSCEVTTDPSPRSRLIAVKLLGIV